MVSDKIQIISLGLADWKKGYDIAIKSCSILKKRQFAFEYIIIGAKKSEEILFLRNDLDLNREIRLIDELPEQQLTNYIKESHIFLQTDISGSTYNKVLEAMCLNTFVIATNTLVNSKLITNKKEGFLIPLLNAKKMAQQIMYYNNLNDQEINQIKKRAFEKAEKTLSVNSENIF